MKIIKKVSVMQKLCWQLRRQGKSIGLVPTMGALHEGHLSLMRRARKENDVVVISIFVNPAQFGPGEDYRRYPRDFEKDKKLARNVGVDPVRSPDVRSNPSIMIGKRTLSKSETSNGVDLIFAPSGEEIYPEGYLTYIDVEKITAGLCGAFRPGHFRGVTTVVLKLFNIVQPDRAYFGQKDYQQYVVIKKMAEDLNLPTEIICCPIVREKDGLAMSSRNAYLSKSERQQACLLYKSLRLAKKMIIGSNFSMKSQEVINQMKELIKKSPLAKIEYIKIVHPETLEEMKKINQDVLIALAVRIGKARLIDNILVRQKG